MKTLENKVVLLTGASRGIGVHIAHALVSEGARIALVARNQQGLETVCRALKDRQATAESFSCDVTHMSALPDLVSSVEARLGPIDVLINNAGVEWASYYEDLTNDDIDQVIAVNLTATLQLSRLVLPGMLERNRGHIVNMASLAGLGAMAFGEPYCAAKHGVVGFTKALRASLQTRGVNVSASAVCPGYVRGEGMFADKQATFGVQAPSIVGTTTPEKVAHAVLKAIKDDRPEVVVNGTPVRPLLSLATLFPWLGERLARLFNVHGVGQAAADGERLAAKSGSAERLGTTDQLEDNTPVR